eukprot:m.34935 g.34935  ORF g.34935 m.34935 type:complete len:693 (-) comp10881_c0_seq1:1444-3522(-)
MGHRFKKVIHSFQAETELRNVLPEIKDVVKAWQNVVKQREQASAVINKWAVTQDDVVSKFLIDVAGLEEEINVATATHCEGYSAYYASWKHILRERKELTKLIEQQNKAHSKLEKAQARLMDATKQAQKAERRGSKGSDEGARKSQDALRAAEAAIPALLAEDEKVTAKVQAKMLEVQQDIHDTIRTGFYSLMDSRMQLCRSWANSMEKGLKLLTQFQRVTGYDEDGEFKYEAFAEPVGPNTEPIWHHGEELQASMDQQLGTSQAAMAKRTRELEAALKEAQENAEKEAARLKAEKEKALQEQEDGSRRTLNKELLRMAIDLGLQGVHDAETGIDADVVDYLAEKATEAQTANMNLTDMPAVHLAVLSRSISGTLFTAMGAAHTLKEEEDSSYLFQLTRETATAATVVFEDMNEKLDSMGDEVPTPDPANVQTLDKKLQELIAFAQKIRVQTEVPTTVAKSISAAQQAIREAIELVQALSAEHSAKDSGRVKEVNQKLFEGGLAMMERAKEVIDSATMMQESLSTGGDGKSLSEGEHKIKFRKWIDALKVAVVAIVDSAPLWIECIRSVSKGEGKHEELQVATRQIGACSASLAACSKTTKKTSQSEEEEHSKMQALSNSLLSLSQTFLKYVRDAQNLSLASILLDEYDSLTENQAKRLVMTTQVEVLRLETALEKEREKLTRLKQLNYLSH